MQTFVRLMFLVPPDAGKTALGSIGVIILFAVKSGCCSLDKWRVPGSKKKLVDV